MAWFNRNRKDKTVLPEIEKYYEAERRERAGLAWLLALVSVACIGLLLIGLFYGGKWAFNRLTDDKKPVAVQTSNDDSTAIKPDGTILDGGSQQEGGQEGGLANPTPAPTTPTPTPAPKPTPTPAPAPAPTPASPTPATSSPLPTTGLGSISLIFVISAFAAWLGHQILLRRKLIR